MEVRDLATWQQRCADLSNDEISKSFLRFVETWANEAERYLAWNEEERSRIAGGVDQIEVVNPAEALRRTLTRTEEELYRADAIFMGQMLAVLAMHWKHGLAMMDDLTPVERRLVEDVTLLKIRHEQVKAEQASGA